MPGSSDSDANRNEVAHSLNTGKTNTNHRYTIMAFQNAIPVTKLMTMNLVDYLSQVQAKIVDDGKCDRKCKNGDVLFVE